MGKDKKIETEEPKAKANKSKPQFLERTEKEGKKPNKFNISADRFGRPFNVDK